MGRTISYQTFWNAKRQELHFTNAYLSEKLGVPISTVGKWFTGKGEPNDSYIQALCDLMGVDFETGKAEFTEAHKSFISLEPNKYTKGHKSRKGVPLKAAWACKDTFWNQQRIENGLKLTDIADYVKLDSRKIGGYFTGQFMPPDDVIDSICDMFDIDSVRGKSEFMKAHAAWDAEHHRSVKLKASVSNETNSNVESVETENVVDINSFILETIYGKFTYEEYKYISDALSSDSSSGDVLSKLYGTLPFDTFNTISDIISRRSI